MYYVIEYSIKFALHNQTHTTIKHTLYKQVPYGCAPQTVHCTPMRDGRRDQGSLHSNSAPCHPATSPLFHTRRPGEEMRRALPRNAHRRSAERLYAALPFPGGALLAHFRRLCARPDAFAPWPVRCCGRGAVACAVAAAVRPAVRPAVRRDEPPTALRARLSGWVVLRAPVSTARCPALWNGRPNRPRSPLADSHDKRTAVIAILSWNLVVVLR